MDDKDYKLYQNRLQLKGMGSYAIGWLMSLGQKVKESGDYPISLTDYYTEKDDIEIAAVVELVIPERLNRRTDYVTELHNLIGPHPAQMVRERNFMHLNRRNSAKDRYILRCTTITKDEVFNLLDWCWKMYQGNQAIEDIMNKYRNPFQDIPNIFQAEEKIKLMKMRLKSKDGIGKGLWKADDDEYLSCPFFDYTYHTLRAFYPIENIKAGSTDEIIEWLGFSPPSDFLYACWGYEKMKHGPHKEKLERFERVFARRFKNGYAQTMTIPNYTTRTKVFTNDLPALN